MNAKSFEISKRELVRAWKSVKTNQGAAGVDGQTIEEFEEHLKDNLYKLWNRMSSGSYFPPAVRRVEIPKGDGKTRPLGIPTVADRVAQMVVVQHLQPVLEPHFHRDSFGYRPGKSAHEALRTTRWRCWRYPWVLDLDIKAYFDSIDHRFLMAAVRRHTKSRWVLLYIERWLKAPVQLPDGTVMERTQGSPQGNCVSPILANLYLHYAFDMWMKREYCGIPFERYADDIVCHCQSEEQALQLKDVIETRLAQWHLELSLQKTKIVYCKNGNRNEKHAIKSFDFLGYTFQPRTVNREDGTFFIGFNPAMSTKAAKAIRQELRRLCLQRRSDLSLTEIAELLNPKLRGWINYYGKYFRSVVCGVLDHVNRYLGWWAMKKYKKLRGRQRKALAWVLAIRDRQPGLFAHWTMMLRNDERMVKAV